MPAFQRIDSGLLANWNGSGLGSRRMNLKLIGLYLVERPMRCPVVNSPKYGGKPQYVGYFLNYLPGPDITLISSSCGSVRYAFRTRAPSLESPLLI
jgi:hypothetical protein